MDQRIAICQINNTSTFDQTTRRLFEENELCKIEGSIYLKLKNKYYETEVQLFDFDSLAADSKTKDKLSNAHAIIICADGLKVSSEQLDNKLDELCDIQGEPRVLLCDNIDEESEPYRTLLDWTLKNGYELILTSESSFKQQLIDSISAYKWPNRNSPRNCSRDQTTAPQLDEGVMNQLKDFDSLLNKLSVYRDKPELRGNSEDKNIEEIAEILSRLMDDEDAENLLDEALGKQSQNNTAE